MDTHFEVFYSVARASAAFAVKVDQRTETAWFAADDRNHQRKSKRARPGEGVRSAANSDPDRQRILYCARIDTLPGQRRTVLAGPVDVGVLTDLQEQLKLFCEKRIVIIEIESEQWIRLDQRA